MGEMLMLFAVKSFFVKITFLRGRIFYGFVATWVLADKGHRFSEIYILSAKIPNRYISTPTLCATILLSLFKMRKISYISFEHVEYELLMS